MSALTRQTADSDARPISALDVTLPSAAPQPIQLEHGRIEPRVGGVWVYTPNRAAPAAAANHAPAAAANRAPLVMEVRGNGAAFLFSPAADVPPPRPQEPRAYATVWQQGGVNHAGPSLGSDYRNAHSSMDIHGVGSW
jgi:hypothetical protein